MNTRRTFLLTALSAAGLPALAPADTPKHPSDPLPRLSNGALLNEVQRRACLFFREKADPKTGLVNDRAKNVGPDDYTVASIASTGYGLAAIPIAVSRKWEGRQSAYDRARRTLRFLRDEMYQNHGWYYHFVDKRTGERVWNCELSSIDTALLMQGVLICGQFFQGTEVQQLADTLYNRVDWHWMRTNGGAKPEKQVLAMGWKPEGEKDGGFLKTDWGWYCELMFLYLQGLGTANNPLATASWDAWKRPIVEYGGHQTLYGGAIFVHQMAHGFYNFKNQRDRQGWDYWVSSREATLINRQFCMDNIGKRKTYAPDMWGLNANDYPDGYKAFAAPGDEDGTVSPTGAIASILFTPDLSKQAAQAIYTQHGPRLWGRYGFGNAFNVDRDWYDPDVIGIDLGMALINIENARTGLVWKLMVSHPSTPRAWKAAGLHTTHEPEPRPLKI